MKKNMKKKIKVLICVLILLFILVGACVFYYLYKTTDLFNNLLVVEDLQNKELAGKKLTDGVYFYDLDIGNYNHDIGIIDGNIYYLAEKDDKYEFYKINIYTNNKEKVGDIEKKDYYCFINDTGYIECAANENEIIYNNKLEKVYEGKAEAIIIYKDGYFRFENNTIYYNDKEYRKLDKDLSNFYIYQYYIFDDNVYIFFGDYEGERYIYNVKENKSEEYEYNLIKQYSNGLYFWNDGKINVTNLNNDEIKQYDNPIKDRFFNTNQLDGNLLYYFSDDYLRVYNLENGKVSLFDYRINKRIDDIIINNNLLYLVTNNEVYILNLDEILLEEMTIDELNTKLENRITNRIKNIYDEYGIDIKIKDEATLEFKVFNETTVGEENYSVINDDLDYIEEVAKIFGKEFFKEFVHDEYTGLRIYIVERIYSDFSMSGEQLKYYDKYALLVDSSEFKRTLCHELMHALEDACVTKGKDIFDKWEEYNPEGFTYIENYDAYDAPYKYSVGNEEADVYFVDNYAQCNGLEDRARIFENICMDTTSKINDNPYLLKKAKYQVEEIKKYYPMLENIEIFNNLD